MCMLSVGRSVLYNVKGKTQGFVFLFVFKCRLYKLYLITKAQGQLAPLSITMVILLCLEHCISLQGIYPSKENTVHKNTKVCTWKA